MPTVNTLLEDWLGTYAKVHCKPSTYRGYKRGIGNPSHSSLRPSTVASLEARRCQTADCKAQYGRGKAKGTIQNVLVPLKAAYNVAIEDGVVTLNPAARLGRLLKGTGDKRQHLQPLTTEEVSILLAKAETQYPVLHPVLLCAVRTGLRMETIGLQWGDVDFHGGFIEVRRAVVMGTGDDHEIT